jgi:hypothetical protein
MAKSQEFRHLGFLFATVLGSAGGMAVGSMTVFGTACGTTADTGNGSAHTADGGDGNTSEGGNGNTSDGGCVSVDASIATLLTLDAGPPGCFSCVTSSCAPTVTKCSKDCTCDGLSVGAFECIENLGPNASLTLELACVTSLVSNSDQDLQALGTCLIGCAGPCEAMADAGEAEADSGAPDSASDSEPTDAGSDSSMESMDAKGDSE